MKLELTNLKSLILEKNKIEFIPKEIGKLKNLQILKLNENKLENIPTDLELLKETTWINLTSNPFLYFDKCFSNLDYSIKENIKNYRILQYKEYSAFQSIQNVFSLFFKSESKIQKCANLLDSKNSSILGYFCDDCFLRHICEGCAKKCHSKHNCYPISTEFFKCQCVRL
jgi:leucine-rich repeat protein SHOC2